MLGGLWRAYRVVATAIFTVQLLALLWVLVDSGTLAWPLATTALAPAATPTPAVASVPRPPASGQTRFTIEISEAEANALLAQREGLSRAVTELGVRFQAGGLVLDARLADPVPVAVRAKGKLVAADGRLRLVLDEAKAGVVPLPSAALELLEGVANEALADAIAGRDVYVESVELLPGIVRLSARVASPS